MFERKHCLTLCMVLLTGCGGGGNGGRDKTDVPVVGGVSNDGVEELGSAGVTTELEGTWVSECSPLEDESAGGYELETTTFNKNRFEILNEFFDDRNCSAPSTTLQDQKFNGTFAIGSSIATSSGHEAKTIDIKVESNQESPPPGTYYSIFYIDQSGLYLGEELVETSATRPRTLDLTNVMTKQGDNTLPGTGGQPESGTDIPGNPDDSDTGNPSVPGNGDGSDDEENGEFAQTLIGEWKGGCTANTTPGGASYSIGQFSFTASGVQYKTEDFEDPDCTVQLSAGAGLTLRGDYTLGNPITSTDGLQATEIDFVFSELNGEVHGLEVQDLIVIQGDTLYLGVVSETGLRPDTLNLVDPYLRQ